MGIIASFASNSSGGYFCSLVSIAKPFSENLPPAMANGAAEKPAGLIVMLSFFHQIMSVPSAFAWFS
jgi:hypothetical protein